MVTLETAAAMLLARRREVRTRPVIYHPLSSVLDTLPTGQAVSIVGTAYEATTFQGLDCIKFDASTETGVYFEIPYTSKQEKAAWNGTVSLWIARYGMTASGNVSSLGVGQPFGSNVGNFMLMKRSGGITATIHRSSTYNNITLSNSTNTWMHVCMLCHIPAYNSGPYETMEVYLNGSYLDSVTGTTHFAQNAFTKVDVGISQGSTRSGGIYVAALRVYDRILANTEIAELAQEFTPVVA